LVSVSAAVVLAACSGTPHSQHGTRVEGSPTTADAISQAAPSTTVSSVNVSAGGSSPSRDVHPCSASEIRARTVGGGSAMAYVSVVVGFFARGRGTCTMSGWPTVKTIGANGAVTATVRSTTSPAIDGGGPSPGQSSIVVTGVTGAYVVIAGTDWNPRHPEHSCPALRRFVITLPDRTPSFSLRATAPTYASRFPNCGPLNYSALVPRSALTIADVAERRQGTALS
jgi:hypothetical protein